MSSFWIDSIPNILEHSNSLDKDIKTDVCIIGGGITGISCAYMLSENGFDVTVLERDKMAYHTTGNTTAKITSQHGLFYKYLIDTFSEDTAKGYLNANQEAINNIHQIIKKEKIDCDFSIQDSYIYTQKDEEVQKIKEEVDSVNSLVSPAEFTTNIPLPINNMLGAIKFPNQAQFHPRKYIAGLCNSMINRPVTMYEDSKVYDVKRESNQYVTYTKNHTVTSKYVILASHYPIINNPGFYFLKMYQEASYIIAIETNQKLFDGMYISSSSPAFSFRTADYMDKKLLLVGGSGHKVGQKIDLSNCYNNLEQKAKEIYPDAKVLYKWQTQDCVSLDKLPYIGEFSTLMPNMYVATGFKKWGITTSNVAANIITDMILGKENKYENVFLSTRFHPIKNKEEFGNIMKETTYSFAINKLKIPDETLEDVGKNEGKIVEVDGNKIGVYKDSNNKIFAIKPICSHLGCELSWNNLEHTWDCPCHGSRFNHMRKVFI